MADVLDTATVIVPGTAATPPPSSAERRLATSHGVSVRLDGRARAGTTSDFRLRLSQAGTGRPINDLRPYLGAAGHVVIIGADGSFAHQHAEAEDDHGRPAFALPGTTFGPDLDLHATFAAAGTYRLWAQFALADGTVVTAPFVVHAR
jgi:Cu+-exporting ATPase